MRVLHVLNDLSDRGSGIVNTAVDLALEQARQGHTVAVAATIGGYEQLLERSGVRHLAVWTRPRKLWHIGALVRAAVEMHSVVAEFKPDIVHAHMRTGLILAWFWSRFYRFSVVAHAHNIHENETVVMGLADRVIAVSNSVADTLERQGIKRIKLRTVLNRTLGNARQPGLAQTCAMILHRPSIVSVAGLFHRKGIAELIAAFEFVGAEFPAAHLYLVGDGPQRALFESQANASTFRDRIHFELFAPVPQTYMLNADIFVLASRRESFGLVLIEAREAGCAVVACNSDGMAEALDDGRAGILVPPNDPPALAQALRTLLADADVLTDYKRRALVGIDAFNVRTFAAQVDAVYQELPTASMSMTAASHASTKPR